MKEVVIDADLRAICRAIVAEGKTAEEWSEVESDDMFEQGDFVGGYDATEEAFCFSYSSEDGREWWFQFSLADAEAIAEGQAVKLRCRPAE